MKSIREYNYLVEEHLFSICLFCSMAHEILYIHRKSEICVDGENEYTCINFLLFCGSYNKWRVYDTSIFWILILYLVQLRIGF